MHRFFVAVFVTLVCGAAHAQVDVHVSLSPPVVPFHEHATFTIVVEAPAEVPVELPDMRDHFGELGVYGIPDHHSEPVGEDRVRVTERYTLDPVHIRSHVIPPVVVTWGDGGVIEVPSPTFRVRELTEAEIEQAQRFEEGLAGGPGAPGQERSYTWIYWAVGAIALTLGALLYVWFRSRGPEVAAEAAKTPWAIALERLATLRDRQLPQLGRYETYYVDLSAILRYYIEGRFQLHAPERTTQEFLGEIAGQGYFTPEQEVFLARFLRLCDRVKFAQFRPDLEAMGVSYEEVELFVDETIPREEPEEEEAAAA